MEKASMLFSRTLLPFFGSKPKKPRIKSPSSGKDNSDRFLISLKAQSRISSKLNSIKIPDRLSNFHNLTKRISGRNYFLLVVVSNSILLASCSDMYEQKPEEPVVSPPIIRVKSLSENQFTLDYIPQESANKYTVKVSWPPYDGHVRILKEKEILNEEQTQENSFLIEDVEGGVESIFSAETYNPEKGLTKDFKLIAKPPKDLVFQGEFFLTSDLTNSSTRIFLTDNSSIYTMNFNLTLNYTKFYFGSNSKIQPFPTGSKAPANTNGRSSGNIKLIGSIPIGHLNVVMNSEEGGNGATGILICRGGWLIVDGECNGSPGGHSGTIGTFLIELDDSSAFEIDSSFLRPAGGAPGAKAVFSGSNTCTNQPSNDSNENWAKCKAPSISGSPASGGSICIRNGIGAAYECKN